MPASKSCIVQRPQFGFLVQGQSLIGNRPSFEVKQVVVDHHELVVYDSQDYMLMCKFCGELDTQLNWNTELKRED